MDRKISSHTIWPTQPANQPPLETHKAPELPSGATRAAEASGKPAAALSPAAGGLVVPQAGNEDPDFGQRWQHYQHRQARWRAAQRDKPADEKLAELVRALTPLLGSPGLRQAFAAYLADRPGLLQDHTGETVQLRQDGAYMCLGQLSAAAKDALLGFNNLEGGGILITLGDELHWGEATDQAAF